MTARPVSVTALAGVTLALLAAVPRRTDAQQSSICTAVPWRQLITSGTAVAVDFDALTGSKGTIRPYGRYRVQFRTGERVWRVSGPKHPDGYQLDVPHPAGSACVPEDYVLCIWGAAFTYNDRGDVLDVTTRVGRLRQLALRDRIVSGESVSVVLNALPSNIGTIKPGGQDPVSFMPSRTRLEGYRAHASARLSNGRGDPGGFRDL